MADTTTTPAYYGSSSSFRIPPLSGADNYIPWRTQLSDILFDQGLWKYVSGEAPSPKRGDTAEWDQADRRALTAIRLRINNDMLLHVISATTSKQAWDALANVFASQGGVARITTRRQLFSYRMEETDDLDLAIRQIKRLWVEFNLIKGENTSALSDNDLAMCILSALPPSWDGLVTSVVINDDLTSSDIISRITQDNARRKARGPDQAFNATARFGKKKFRKGVNCHKCGKEGHIRPECNEPDKPASATAVVATADTLEEYAF